MVGAKPNPETAHNPARILIQTTHILQNFTAFKDAKGFTDLESDTARNPRQLSRFFELHRRAKQPHNVGFKPSTNSGFNFFAGSPGKLIIRDQPHLRLIKLFARLKFGNRFSGPTNDTVISNNERRICGSREPLCP